MSALIDAIGSPGKASVLSPLANKLVLKAATVGGLHQGIAGRPTFRAEILKTASESWWYWTFDERDPKKNVISTANLLNFGMQQRFASLGIMHSALTADLESGKSLSQLMDSLIEIQDKMLAAIQKEFMQHRRHLVRSFTNWINICFQMGKKRKKKPRGTKGHHHFHQKMKTKPSNLALAVVSSMMGGKKKRGRRRKKKS